MSEERLDAKFTRDLLLPAVMFGIGSDYDIDVDTGTKDLWVSRRGERVARLLSTEEREKGGFGPMVRGRITRIIEETA